MRGTLTEAGEALAFFEGLGALLSIRGDTMRVGFAAGAADHIDSALREAGG